METRNIRHELWDDEPTNPFEVLHAVRVLLAEDDPTLRAMMAARLRSDGCEVVEACSGDEALELIATIANGESEVTNIDLAIMDVRMPGLSGIDVLACLRAWRWEAPVLFVTAYPDDELIELAAALDARVLAKPFGLSRLSTTALETLHDVKRMPRDGGGGRA